MFAFGFGINSSLNPSVQRPLLAPFPSILMWDRALVSVVCRWPASKGNNKNSPRTFVSDLIVRRLLQMLATEDKRVGTTDLWSSWRRLRYFINPCERRGYRSATSRRTRVLRMERIVWHGFLLSIHKSEVMITFRYHTNVVGEPQINTLIFQIAGLFINNYVTPPVLSYVYSAYD